MSDLESLFQSLVQTSGLIVWKSDETGFVEALHPGLHQEGFEHWLGHGWQASIHPDDAAQVRAAWARAAEEGVAAQIEHRYMTAKGYRWFRVRGTPLRDADGRTGWIGVTTDINDDVLARLELARRERAYRALVEASASLVWRANPDGGMIEGHGWDAYSDLHGDEWLSNVHPADQAEAAAGWAKIFASGEPGRLTFRARTNAGDYHWCDARAVPVRAPCGEIEAWIGTLHDIQDRKLAMDALHRRGRLNAVGRLTAGVGHDFNNLLTVITAGAETLVEALPEASAAREEADLILHAAHLGAELVARLLAFARQQPLRPQPVCIAALFDSLEPLVRRGLGPDIDLRLADGKARLHCVADPAQLEAALMNLCTNARDAMADGGRLDIGAREEELSSTEAAQLSLAPGRYAVLEVRDSGPGMPKAVLDHAIEPFFTTKESGRGAGLGLSMVYGFVRQSDGALAISSAEGEGTTVRLYLPVCDAPVEQANVEAEDGALDGVRVLLVEDDELVRWQVTRQLEALGCRVESVSSAPAALARLEAGGECDLVLTDCMMPGGMSGRQLARAAVEMLPGLPVVLTSGYAPAAENLPEDPDFAFLQKPYRRAVLASALRSALSHNRRQAPPPGEPSIAAE